MDMTSMHDHESSDEPMIEDNNAFLMAMGEGSRIEIHAADASKESWGQLDATIEEGSTTLVMDTVTGWEIGDRIAVAASGFDGDNAEEFTIVDAVVVDGKTHLTLDKPVENFHFGELQSYDNGLTGDDYQEWVLDERAEVALLTRNVTIQGDEDSAVDQYGGHTMVMHGADMHVSGAAFANMGQAGEMGRYPIHFHMLGDTSEGNYVSDVSVVNSFNKGITIHASNNTWLEDNVVYNTIGHGFFFEDGAETGNVLKGNLAFDQDAATEGEATIPTDTTHVASYWITNPNNHFLNNHAGGSDHSGFFFSYEDKVTGLSALSGMFEGYVPGAEKFGLFAGNTSHSNKFNLWTAGDTLDDGTFDPNSFSGKANEDGNFYEIHVQDFTSYRAFERAIFNKNEGGVYTDIKSANNNSDFFLLPKTLVENSLFVGRSANIGDLLSAAEHEQGTELSPGQSFNGYAWYDGGQLLLDSHFTGYTGENDTAFSLKSGNTMGGGNAASGITFGDDMPFANLYSHANYFNGQDLFGANQVAVQVLDIDGSISGTPMATLTSGLAHYGAETFGFQAAPDATYVADWNVWVNAPEHDIGKLKVWLNTIDPFEIVRSDGKRFTLGDNTSANEVLIMADTDYSYTITNPNEINTEVLSFWFEDLRKGASVYLTFEGVDEKAVLDGATLVADKEAADALNETTYYVDAKGLHVKIFADSRFTDDISREGYEFDETLSWGDHFKIDIDGDGGLTARGNYLMGVVDETEVKHPVVADVNPAPEKFASTSNTVDLTGSEARWSHLMTWEHAAPETDSIVVIGEGERVVLDADAIVKGIVINGGELIVEDVQDLSLSADWILVYNGGLFQVGTEDNPFVHDFTLTLEGDDKEQDLDIGAILNGMVANTVFTKSEMDHGDHTGDTGDTGDTTDTGDTSETDDTSDHSHSDGTSNPTDTEETPDHEHSGGGSDEIGSMPTGTDGTSGADVSPQNSPVLMEIKQIFELMALARVDNSSGEIANFLMPEETDTDTGLTDRVLEEQDGGQNSSSNPDWLDNFVTETSLLGTTDPAEFI